MVALNRIRLNKFVRREQKLVKDLQNVGPTDFVIGGKRYAGLSQIWGYALVILPLGEFPNRRNLRLNLCVPLGQDILLSLLRPRGSMLDNISTSRREDVTVKCLVIRADEFDIGVDKLFIVWLSIGRNCILCLEIVLADKWRGIVTGFERGRASENDGEDSSPRREPRGPSCQHVQNTAAGVRSR